MAGTHLGHALTRIRSFLEKTQSSHEQLAAWSQGAVTGELLPLLCCSGQTFVDVGAHVGSVVAAIRRADPLVEIIAIEADPQKAWRLSRRWPKMKIHACAVGDSNHDVSFYVNSVRPGFSSLRNVKPSETTKITVPMRRLDQLVAKADVIKIDVEGAELDVLTGATQLVEKCRPTIVFESGVAGIGDCELLFDWFDKRSYNIFVPSRVAHNGPPLTRDGFVECHWYPARTNDYFAIASERRLKIRDKARKILGVRLDAQSR